jgi:hypothetical protein
MGKSVIVKESSYTYEELKAIDCIVEKEKSKGKIFKSEKEFSNYIRKLTK